MNSTKKIYAEWVLKNYGSDGIFGVCNLFLVNRVDLSMTEQEAIKHMKRSQHIGKIQK